MSFVINSPGQVQERHSHRELIRLMKPCVVTASVLAIICASNSFASNSDDAWSAFRKGEFKTSAALFETCLSGTHDDAESLILKKLALVYARQNLQVDELNSKLSERDEWQQKKLAENLIEQFGSSDLRSSQLRTKFGIPEPKAEATAATPRTQLTEKLSPPKAPSKSKAAIPVKPTPALARKLSSREIEKLVAADEEIAKNEIIAAEVYEELMLKNGLQVPYPEDCELPQYPDACCSRARTTKRLYPFPVPTTEPNKGYTKYHFDIALSSQAEKEKIAKFYHKWFYDNGWTFPKITHGSLDGKTIVKPDYEEVYAVNELQHPSGHYALSQMKATIRIYPKNNLTLVYPYDELLKFPFNSKTRKALGQKEKIVIPCRSYIDISYETAAVN
ncbi:MAG: hypothetical protein K2X27_10555 [Candidatus Obscuribacterales bacterium]|nr:hypothetical protein [Candidatus Obscuribacterales bacterium]